MLDLMKRLYNALSTFLTGYSSAVSDLSTLEETAAGHTTSIGTLEETVSGHTTAIGSLETDVGALEDSVEVTGGDKLVADMEYITDARNYLRYQKIGRLVVVSGWFDMDTNSAVRGTNIFTLPFASEKYGGAIICSPDGTCRSVEWEENGTHLLTSDSTYPAKWYFTNFSYIAKEVSGT